MIDIIIVNWNSGFLLTSLIASILKHHKGLVKSVVIVDNASTDNSLIGLEEFVDLPFDLKVIRNHINRGFGYACNQGALMSESEFLLFLNPDTLLFDNSLEGPTKFLKNPENNEVGICGIKLVDEHGRFTTTAARFPTFQTMMGQVLGLSKLLPFFFPPLLMSPKDLKESCIVDQVIGAFFLIRRNVFNQCNGFDESFFVYFEEVDLSLRARQIGYSSFYLSSATAFHKGGGCSENAKSIRLFYSLRSRIYYANKHYSFLEFFGLIGLTGVEFPLRLLLGALKCSMSDIKNTISAYIKLMRYLIRGL